MTTTASDITVYSYTLSNGGAVTGCNEADAVTVCQLLGGWESGVRVLHGYQISLAAPAAKNLQQRLRKVRESFPAEFALLAKPSREYVDITLPVE